MRKFLITIAAAVIYAGSTPAPLPAQQQADDPPPDQAAIEGMVINTQNGRVVPRAEVVLRNLGRPAARSTRADGAGHFLFNDVDPGAYRLSAERPGFFVDTRHKIFQTSIAVASGDHRTGVLVRLSPTGVVIGQVVDESSDPMQHVQVRLLARAYRGGRIVLDTEGQAVTDDRGTYRIYGVRPGHYYVVADVPPGVRAKGEHMAAGTGIVGSPQVSGAEEIPPEPDTAYSTLFYPNTSDFLQAQDLPVKPGDEVQANFSFLTLPSVSIRGRITNGLTGGPAENATVTAYWTEYLEGSGVAGKVAPKDGTFEVRGLAPGLYTLRGSFSNDGSNYTFRQTVEVGPGGAGSVLLIGLPDSDIAGSVRLDSPPLAGSPLRRVSVEFQSETTPARSSSVAVVPNLEFQARLHPGDRYVVAASGLPQDYYLKAVRISGHDVDRNDVVVSDRRAAVELVLSADGGHIQGLLLDEKSQPISGSVVLVPEPSHRDSPDLFRKSAASGRGEFTFRGVPPGTYKLLAFDDVDLNELVGQPALLKQYEDRGETVIVSEKGNYSVPLKIIRTEDDESLPESR